MQLCGSLNILWLWDEHIFSSCGHCWVFQFCWHADCSTVTASPFRILNSWSHFVRTLHYDLSLLGSPAWHGSELYWVTQAPLPWQGCVPWRDHIHVKYLASFPHSEETVWQTLPSISVIFWSNHCLVTINLNYSQSVRLIL